MIIDGLPTLSSPVSTDELPIERGTAAFKIPLSALVSNLVIKQAFTLTTDVSLNSLASTSYDVTVTAPSGYKPLAALEGRVNGGIFAVTCNLINTTTARAYVINAGSTVRTGTGVTVDVLFIRDI